jgi:hypothetical protein
VIWNYPIVLLWRVALWKDFRVKSDLVAMTEGGGTGVGNGPLPKNRKKNNYVKFGFNFSHLPPPKKILALFLDFMAISNKFFWPY